MAENKQASVPLDHHSAEFARHWPEITTELRQGGRCPIVHTEAHGGYWAVLGHPEAMEIVVDTDRYMSGRRDGESSIYFPSMPLQMVPLEVDPPLQTSVRRILNPIFTDRMAAAWAPFIRDVTDVHIDGFIERGSGDLVLELARRVTAVVNLALVGVTGFEEVDEFIDAPGLTLRTEPGSPEYERAIEVTRAVEQLFREALADRRRTPRNDVITVIAHMELEGNEEEAADEEFLLRMLQTIVSGGNSTTTSLIGHAFIWLSEHPDVRERVAGDEALLEELLEEVVRLCAPACNLGRTVREPGDVAGHHFDKGEHLLLVYGAANRDERVFERPDEVVFGRTEKRHLAYGWGRHRCLGRSFARQMSRTIVGRVLERLPDFHVDVEGVQRYGSIPVVNGLTAVPATFTPGERVGAEMPVETPPLPDKVAI